MAPRILFLTSDKPIAKLIRWFTRGPVSHVAIGVEGYVLHAKSGGVLLEPERQLVRDGFAQVAAFEVIPDVQAGLGRALAQVGKGYDVADLVAWPVRAMQRRYPRRDLDRARWTCTRLVLALDPTADRSVIPEWRGVDAALVTPTELLSTMHGPSFRPV